jgi:hypothetical protein
MKRDTKEERKERRGEKRERREERERGEKRERRERERREKREEESGEGTYSNLSLYIFLHISYLFSLFSFHVFFFPDLSKVKILIHTRCKLYQVYANNIALSGTSF